MMVHYQAWTNSVGSHQYKQGFALQGRKTDAVPDWDFKSVRTFDVALCAKSPLRRGFLPGGGLTATNYQRGVDNITSGSYEFWFKDAPWPNWVYYGGHSGAYPLWKAGGIKYGDCATGAVALPQSLIAKAEQKALANLSNKTANLLMLWAERKSTLGLAVSIFSKACRAINLFRRGRFSEAMRLLRVKNPKAWANYYLAFIFGLRPLASDLNSLKEEIETQLGEDRPTVVRGYGIADEKFNPAYISNTYGCKIKGRGRASVKVSLEGTIWSYYLGLLNAVANPLVFAWDAVPFSFIVDWFIDIGTWLRSLTATLGLRFSRGSRGERSEAKFSVEPPDVDQMVGTPPKYDREMLAFQRRVYVKFPGPGLPHFGDPLRNLKSRLVTSLALIVQRR